MLARSLIFPLLLLAAAPSAMARTVDWSGYSWNVRPVGVGGPGQNRWSDSPANVRLDGPDLVLSIVQDAAGCWTSAEVSNQQPLGYGTYRWVVASDLSGLDAADVLGMFTYGRSEIDIEASHWGNRSWPSGSATVWPNAAGSDSESRSFRYSGLPPYLNQFRWEPGRITYRVTDAAGASLLNAMVTRGVPAPSGEVPMINFWRYRNAPPAGPRSIRLTSFSWIPLGRNDAPPALPASEATAPSGGRAAAPGNCVQLTIRPRRFALDGPDGGATISWSAATRTRLRMLVERLQRGRRWIRVGVIRRVVRDGAGRMRFDGRIGGRRLRPGRYRLIIRTNAGARTALRFTVLAG